MTTQKEYLVTSQYSDYRIETNFFISLEEAKLFYDQIRKIAIFVILSKIISSSDQKSF